MSKRYLKQDGTGRIYIYTDALAKRHDMRECDAPAAAEESPKAPRARRKSAAANTGAETDAFEQDAIIIDGAAVKIADATAKQIVDYAERQFGITLNLKSDRKDLETALQAAIEEFGHPDAQE